ncbi:MAG: DegT/DnrJ/EryC1/StrS family aminotransferase [Gammaproteobacteria bacterium]|jgi:dTDP-4-amino-4,6-dideoxygalactose transaminase
MSSRVFINVPMSSHLEYKNLIKLLPSSQNFFTNWRASNKHLYLLPKGAIALKLLCELYLTQQNKKVITLFVPDYICNSALVYIRMLPVKLVFYPISAELRPDWDSIERLAKHSSPDLLLLVHYFGVKNDLTGAVDFCKRYSCHLIEDAAHVLMPVADIGRYSWATFFCPYKFLALPDGGAILQFSTDIEQSFINDKNLGYDIDYSLPLKWLCKRILIKGCDLLRLSWPAALPRSHAEGDVVDFGKTVEKFYKQSVANLLGACDAKQVKLKRRCNYKRLTHNIKGGDITPIFPKLEAEEIPYVLPIRSSEDIASCLYAKMLKHGVPVQAWPDLPQEVLACPGEHRAAMNLRATVNLLPVHQSLKERHLQKIIKVLNEYK